MSSLGYLTFSDVLLTGTVPESRDKRAQKDLKDQGDMTLGDGNDEFPRRTAGGYRGFALSSSSEEQTMADLRDAAFRNRIQVIFHKRDVCTLHNEVSCASNKFYINASFIKNSPPQTNRLLTTQIIVNVGDKTEYR